MATTTEKTDISEATSAAKTCGTKASLSAGTCASVCEDALRELAYLKWESAGCPTTDGVDFWLEAEQELQVKE